MTDIVNNITDNDTAVKVYKDGLASRQLEEYQKNFIKDNISGIPLFDTDKKEEGTYTTDEIEDGVPADNLNANLTHLQQKVEVLQLTKHDPTYLAKRKEIYKGIVDNYKNNGVKLTPQDEQMIEVGAEVADYKAGLDSLNLPSKAIKDYDNLCLDPNFSVEDAVKVASATNATNESGWSNAKSIAGWNSKLNDAFTEQQLTANEVVKTKDKVNALYASPNNNFVQDVIYGFGAEGRQAFVDNPLTAIGVVGLSTAAGFFTSGLSTAVQASVMGGTAVIAGHDFATTRATVASNAMASNPSLDFKEAMYSLSAIGPATFNAVTDVASGGLMTAGKGVVSKGAWHFLDKYNEKLIKTGLKTKEQVAKENFNFFTKLKTPMSKALINESSDVIENIGLNSASAVLQQLGENYLGNKQDLSENVWAMAKQGAMAGALMQAVPSTIRWGKTLHSMTASKERANAVSDFKRGLSNHANNQIFADGIEGKNADEILNENEDKYIFIDREDLANVVQQNNIDLNGTWLAKYIPEDDNVMPIAVPQSEWVKHYNDKSDIIQNLKDLSADDPTFMTMKEAQEVILDDRQEQMLKQETANFKKIMEESVSDNKKSDFVSQDFKAQMFENEKKGADNLSKADDMGDFVATVFTYLGKITGEDTVDLYNRYKPTVVFEKRARNLNGDASDEGVLGTYDSANRKITLYEDSDTVTVMHETTHFFMDMLESAVGIINDKLNKHVLENGSLNLNDPTISKLYNNAEQIKGMLDNVSDVMYKKEWDKLNDAEKEKAKEQLVNEFFNYLASDDKSDPLIANLFSKYSDLLVSSYQARLRKQFNLQQETLSAEAKERYQEKLDNGEVNFDDGVNDKNEKYFADQAQYASKEKVKETIKHQRYSAFENDTTNPQFDSIMQSLFDSREIIRELDDKFDLSSNLNTIDTKELGATPQGIEALKTIKEVQSAVANRLEQFKQYMDKQFARLSGAMFNFTDEFKGTYDSQLKDVRSVNAFMKKGSEADKELFNKLKEKYSKELSNYEELFNAFRENGINADELKAMVKNGELSERQFKDLQQKGFIKEDGLHFVDMSAWAMVNHLTIEDVKSLAKKYKNFDDFISLKAVKGVIENNKAKYTQELSKNGKLRSAFLKMYGDVITTERQGLNRLVKGVNEKFNETHDIKAIARKLVDNSQVFKRSSNFYLGVAKSQRHKAQRAIAKGDFESAQKHYRTSAVALEMAKVADKKMIAIHARLSSMLELANRGQGKLHQYGYDNDTLDALRYILKMMGVRSKVLRFNYKDLVKRAEENTSEDTNYNQAVQIVEDLKKSNLLKNYSDMTLAELELISDKLAFIKKLSRDDNFVTVNGKRIRKDELAEKIISETLYKKHIVDGKIELIKDEDGNPIKEESVNRKSGQDLSQRWFDRKYSTVSGWLRHLFGRAEVYIRERDGQDNGILHQTVFKPLHDAIDRLSHNCSEYTKRANVALNIVYSEIEKSNVGHIVAVDDNGQPLLIDPISQKPVVFGQGDTSSYGNGALDVFGLLLHMGNDSNRQKLLKGYGWTPENFDKFINKMVRDGVLTKEMFKAVGEIWKLNKEVFEKADKAFYKVNGYHVKELQYRPVELTFNDGETIRLDGGYVPLIMNEDIKASSFSNVSSLADMNAMVKEIHPALSDGWSLERGVNKNYPVVIDPLRILNRTTNIVGYYTLAPTLHDVKGIVEHPYFVDQFNSYDRQGYKSFIHGLLEETVRTATNRIENDPLDNPLFNKFVANTGMGLMFCNITNAIQQLAGFSSALTQVKAKYLKDGIIQATTNYKEVRALLCENSDFFRNRLQVNQSNLIDIPAKLALPKHAFGNTNKLLLTSKKASQWLEDHAYFMQKRMQDYIDIGVAYGKYMQCLQEGMSEADAIASAESAVRMSQSSSARIDKSHLENMNAVTKACLQFTNYFFTVFQVTLGRYKRLRRLNIPTQQVVANMAYVFTVNVILPASISGAISNYAHQNKSKDDEFMKDFGLMTIGETLKTVAKGTLIGSVVVDPLVEHYIYGEKLRPSSFLSNPSFMNLGAIGDGLVAIARGKFSSVNATAVLNLVASASGFGALNAFTKRIRYLYDAHVSGKIKYKDMEQELISILTGYLPKDVRRYNSGNK